MSVVQLSSENYGWGMSPRISFSHDLQAAHPDVQVDVLLAGNCRVDDHAADFRFDVRRGVEAETSTADELFSGGKILPLLLRSNSKHPGPPPPVPALVPKKDQSLKEAIAADEPSAAGSLKSLFNWRFKRSGNLKSSLLHKLPVLHRSNSTGCFADDLKKKPATVPSPLRLIQPMSSPVPAKKNEKAPIRSIGYGHGVRISPVLNVPPPYISSGTTNLFGFGYFFRPVIETPTNSKKSDKNQFRKAKILQ